MVQGSAWILCMLSVFRLPWEGHSKHKGLPSRLLRGLVAFGACSGQCECDRMKNAKPCHPQRKWSNTGLLGQVACTSRNILLFLQMRCLLLHLCFQRRKMLFVKVVHQFISMDGEKKKNKQTNIQKKTTDVQYVKHIQWNSHRLT